VSRGVGARCRGGDAQPAEHRGGVLAGELVGEVVHGEVELVVGAAEHQRFVGAETRQDGVAGGQRDQVAVDDGTERQSADEGVRDLPERTGGAVGGQRRGPRLLGEDLLLGERAQARPGGRHPGQLGQAAAGLLRQGGREVGGHPGDHDGPSEQGQRARHRQQGEHRAAAGRLPGDGHQGRVAAEEADVVTHPLQRQQPVEHPAVQRRILDPAETVEAEPVRHVHGDHTVPVEAGAVVPGAGRGAGGVTAAVDVDQHRQSGAVGSLERAGREDAHVQRRLAGEAGLGHQGGVAAVDPLRGGAGAAGIQHAGPGRMRRGSGEAQLAHRRGGVGNAEERGGTGALTAADDPCCGADVDGVHLRPSWCCSNLVLLEPRTARRRPDYPTARPGSGIRLRTRTGSPGRSPAGTPRGSTRGGGAPAPGRRRPR